MNFKGKKFVASYSGGKDSILAMKATLSGAQICEESGISAYFPLWHESREKLVKEFIAEGFSAYITIVDTSRLTEKHLGMLLSEPALKSIQADGADVCGENGEYHSFVFDGPIFSRPVSFRFGETVEQDKYRILPLVKS